MEITVKIDLSESFKKFVTDIMALGSDIPEKAEVKPLKAVKTPKPETVKPEEDDSDLIAAPVKKVKEIDLEDLRAFLQPIMEGGRKAEIKKVLTEYGANKLDNLNSKHYQAVMDAFKK